ncbi:alpha/beta hydrolase fold domain-containing protein [Pseudonocardia kujensis]|uniref:alpha/beta hydrolase fold domain-containing protein n=1 Tax=Pseudonocardia kujensis TaxID=1128675 RepID=UPI003555EE30
MGQLLACPMIDDRNDTVSSLQMKGRGLGPRANQACWDSLLGFGRGGPDVSPYAAAARATDLAGPRPTVVDVGSVEAFRDEAVACVRQIWATDGRAELQVRAGRVPRFRHPGAGHGRVAGRQDGSPGLDRSAAGPEWPFRSGHRRSRTNGRGTGLTCTDRGLVRGSPTGSELA